jgi:hypothetical protein
MLMHLGLYTEGDILKPECVGLYTEGDILKPECVGLYTEGDILKPECVGLYTEGDILKPECGGGQASGGGRAKWRPQGRSRADSVRPIVRRQLAAPHWRRGWGRLEWTGNTFVATINKCALVVLVGSIYFPKSLIQFSLSTPPITQLNTCGHN